MVEIHKFTNEDIAAMTEIWNEVVRDGVAFPQMEELRQDDGSAKKFFSAQSYCAVAADSDSAEVIGLYILHPNNVGRCGHISNASFAVSSKARGKGVGRQLVEHCLAMGKELGFKILQFNAVGKTNSAAHSLYKSLGFVELGVIPDGFLLKNGKYEDIVLYYHTL